MGGTAKRVSELGGGRQNHSLPSSRWSLGGATQVVLWFYFKYFCILWPYNNLRFGKKKLFKNFFFSKYA